MDWRRCFPKQIGCLFRGYLFRSRGLAQISPVFFDFATRQVRPLFEVDEDFCDGPSISPDGRWIMYSLFGDVSSDIMVVDHFH
jgi:hypothetical protein